MAAELVMGKDGLALMILKEQGWHGMAHVKSDSDGDITVDECHDILQTKNSVRREALAYPDGTISKFSFGVRITVDDKDLEVATVGPETAILQNRDFVELGRTWVDNDLGKIIGAGLLSSGSVIFLQIRAADLDSAIIRTLPGSVPDAVDPMVVFVNGHGGLGMLGGWTNVRVVCRNTLSAAMRSFKSDTSTRKTHRAKNAQTEGEKSCLMKMTDVHRFMIGVREDWLDKVEIFRYLDSIKLKGGDKTLYEFSYACAGKKPSLVSSEDFNPSRKDLEIVEFFNTSPGTISTTWWDAFNARTYQLTHGRTNEMEGDTAGDKKARRFADLMLGPRAAELGKSLSVAFEMAKAQA